MSPGQMRQTKDVGSPGKDLRCRLRRSQCPTAVFFNAVFLREKFFGAQALLHSGIPMPPCATYR